MQNKAIQKFEYHPWANKRVFAKLRELPTEVYEQEITSVFSSISEVITHIYQVDGMWLSVMSGDAFKETMKVIEILKNDIEGKDLNQMEDLYKGMADKYRSFIKNLGDPNEPMKISHPHFGDMEVIVSDLVDHIVNHGTYHQGNITAMLRQQGYSGVPTDYILYLYELTTKMSGEQK